MPKSPGRPKGVLNSPDPIHASIVAALGRQRISRKRPDKQHFLGTKAMNGLKIDQVTYTVLKLHALRRNVPLSWMVSDVLCLWVAMATDYDQAIYKDILPQGMRGAKVPERFVGYLASLGFADEETSAQVELPLRFEAPTPASALDLSDLDHSPLAQSSEPTRPLLASASQTIEPQPEWSEYPGPLPEPQAEHSQQLQPPQSPLPAERSLADLARPFQHPSTQGPAAYPHPQPSLPAGSRLFEPGQRPSASGFGNAAQQATEGGLPDPSQPALPAEVERYLAHYRVNPEDVR